MNQKECLPQTHSLNPDRKANELDSIEKSILTVLQNHQQNRIIDVSWLQSECRRIGFSPKEFSHGFVKLLISGHLKPHGEFTYVLVAEKKNEVFHGL